MSSSLFAQAMRELFHHHQAWPASFYEERLSFTYGRFLKSGDVAVDVGAHTGYHATRVWDLIGPDGMLYCIEPLPEIFSQLKQALSGKGNVVLFNGVLSDTQGDVSFERAIGLPGESGLLPRKRYDLPGVRTETMSVKSRTLDELVSSTKQLDYVKIDTEGAELKILSAADRVLRDLRPVISVEWGSDTYLPYGHDAMSLYDFARSHEYTIVDLFANMICSGRQWLEVSDRASWDFLLVPDEKLAWYIYSQNAE